MKGGHQKGITPLDTARVTQIDTNQMRLGKGDLREILECILSLGIRSLSNIQCPTRANIQLALEEVLTQEIITTAMQNADQDRGGRLAIAGNLQRLLDFNILPERIRQATIAQIRGVEVLNIPDSDRVNPHYEKTQNAMSPERKRQFLNKILREQITSFSKESRENQRILSRDLFNTQIEIALLGTVPNYITSHIQSWNDANSIMQEVILDSQEEYPSINISFDRENFTVTLQKISAVH